MEGPQYRPTNIVILIMGIPEKTPLILGIPHFPAQLEFQGDQDPEGLEDPRLRDAGPPKA